MRIGITEPTSGDTPTGNRRQATQWGSYLRELGHEVELGVAADRFNVDALIALNASKSHDSIVAFRAAHPSRPIIVVLTGTDIYPAPDQRTIEAIRIADRIVTLQARAAQQIPSIFRDKLSVIVQAAAPPSTPPAARSTDPFQIAVVSHLREVKDPLRAAKAARMLPPASKIRVRLAGDVLDAEYREMVAIEVAENARFEWLGPLDATATGDLIAASQLVVVSSFFEGGARVIGDSVVLDTPLLAARNDASASLLKDDYPGLYEAGNTLELAALMLRAETDSDFRDTLHDRIAPLVPRFDPQRERAALQTLIQELPTARREDHEPRDTGASAGS